MFFLKNHSKVIMLLSTFHSTKVTNLGKRDTKMRENIRFRNPFKRVISRLKEFRTMQPVTLIAQVSLLDNIMIVIATLINLNKSVILN